MATIDEKIKALETKLKQEKAKKGQPLQPPPVSQVISPS